MKVTEKGHVYELVNFEKDGTSQNLVFIKKTPDPEDPTKLITVFNGTTNEEVLSALINRLEFLQDKFPCSENEIAILNLKSALQVLELRTANRTLRGVEGKQIK